MENKNPYHLIGLTGVAENEAKERIGSARVGKDEIGHYLSKVVRCHHQLSFAAPLYKVAEHAYGIPKFILENPSVFQKEEQIYAPWGQTLREILQTIGTELFRDNVDPDFWVKRANMELEKLKDRVVMTDVRMENEASLIRNKGGTIVHVHRIIDSGKVKAHRSEATVEVFPEDLHIYNYGTKEDLYKQLDELIVNHV